MRVIGRFQGVLGKITLLESQATGDRVYMEGEIFQSESSPMGISRSDVAANAAVLTFSES